MLKLHAHSEGHKQLRDPRRRTLDELVRVPVLQQQVKGAEPRLTGYFAEHNLPFSLMDHLSDLLKSVCPDSNVAAKIKCKRTKVMGVVRNIMGPHFRSHYQLLKNWNVFTSNR